MVRPSRSSCVARGSATGSSRCSGPHLHPRAAASGSRSGAGRARHMIGIVSGGSCESASGGTRTATGSTVARSTSSCAWTLQANSASPTSSHATSVFSSGFAAGCIAIYKRFLSPLLPRACRYYPTCSAYAAQAIAAHGTMRGSRLALVRLLSCHPFARGGYDPCP
ncbi:MAG: membrane protein insertion efficiency factor YidD [Acidobacteriota bacterium]